MTRRRIFIGCLLLAALLIIAVASACTVMPEPEYAASLTESTVLGMSNGDYDEYTEHFSPETKGAVTEDAFTEASNLINSRIGEYVSKEFWKTEVSGQYTVVYYKAKFTQEPADVVIRAVFEEVDGSVYLAGFWFDSPKLRQQ